jgi:hypothetical protein
VDDQDDADHDDQRDDGRGDPAAATAAFGCRGCVHTLQYRWRRPTVCVSGHNVGTFTLGVSDVTSPRPVQKPKRSCRPRPPDVDEGQRLDYEREDYLAFRWWPRPEIISSNGRFYPGPLPALLDAFLHGGQINEPFELWS